MISTSIVLHTILYTFVQNNQPKLSIEELDTFVF